MLLPKITPIISHVTSQTTFGRRAIWCNFFSQAMRIVEGRRGNSYDFFRHHSSPEYGGVLSILFHCWQVQAQYVLAIKAVTLSDRY